MGLGALQDEGAIFLWVTCALAPAGRVGFEVLRRMGLGQLQDEGVIRVSRHVRVSRGVIATRVSFAVGHRCVHVAKSYEASELRCRGRGLLRDAKSYIHYASLVRVQTCNPLWDTLHELGPVQTWAFDTLMFFILLLLFC